MESRRMAERIDELLAEADEIERTVETVQVERPSSWAPEDVRRFRKRYQDYYASALLALPHDTKEVFVKEYAGGAWQIGIQKFIFGPTQPSPLFAKAAEENPEALSPLYWLYPVESTFSRRFAEQQSLLRQARQRCVMESTLPDRRIPGLLGGWAGEGAKLVDGHITQKEEEIHGGPAVCR